MEDRIPKIGQSTGKRAGNRGMGRPKGSVNKTTKTLKEALLNSFETLGSEKWLVSLAESDPKAYASLLGRLVPSEVKAEVSSPDERIVITGGHFIVRDSWPEIPNVIVDPPLPEGDA